MKIVIIEDEGPAARRLSNLVIDCNPDAEILTVIPSVAEGIRWFKENKVPDLIISDIQLSDDLSFTIFKELDIKAPVIFTTAYDKYAIKAFRFYSIDYLLKPIKKEDLSKSLQKLEQLKNLSNHQDLRSIIENFKTKEHKSRFLVYSKNVLITIPVEEVNYLFSEDGGTFICTNDEKQYAINESLDQLERRLDPTIFFRANRQFIISIGSVKKVHPYFNQKLKLEMNKCNKEVIISKLKATEFKNWLNQ